jgi:DNA-binding transcriptional regulator/RsmH inhibitor MraZ
VTVHRLSPKNQVTIPRDARVFTASAAQIDHLRARRHMARQPDSGELFPTILLMPESELKEREARITADASLTVDQKFAIIARINDEMKALAIDGQNRVVLPAECVAHIGVGASRDVKFVCTNTVIQIWHPDHYERFAGTSAKPKYDETLAKYLSL